MQNTNAHSFTGYSNNSRAVCARCETVAYGVVWASPGGSTAYSVLGRLRCVDNATHVHDWTTRGGSNVTVCATCRRWRGTGEPIVEIPA
jgi:hypothetical protein